MGSNNRLKKELQEMKKQLNQLSGNNTDISVALQEQAKSEEIGSNLLTLFKYVMNEQKNLDMKISGMAHELQKINMRIEENINADYYEQEDQEPYPQENKLAKVQPISGLDAQILQIIQRSAKEMACADEIKKQMNYKGRNAASARLNKLYKMGMLERYQLGHKVYYRFDAGKTTNTLIVSPPQ